MEVNGKKRKAFFATLNGATSESLFAIEGIGFIGSRPFEADMMNPNLNECACMPEYVVELEFMQKTDDRFHYEFRRDDFDFSFGSAESINPDSPGLRLSADNLYFNAPNPDRLTASLADTSGRDDCNKRGATARGHLYCDAEVGQGIDFKRENPRQPPLNAAAESLRRLDDSNHISTVVSTVVSGVGLTNMSTGGCCVSSSASHVSATSFIRRS